MYENVNLLKLKRWNTPTICNGWEKITKHDFSHECFNLEETTDFMPQMGPMVGYAVTVKIEPRNIQHTKRNANVWNEYLEYVASRPEPKIVVVQDLDKPATFGSFWGEVNSNLHRGLGCVGTITDGSIRDVDEMTNAGFKALARRLSVSHAYSTPVEWNCEVEVFGQKIQPGQLIHADKHGFLAIPDEDVDDLLDAVLFMDNNECETLIAAARNSAGKTKPQLLEIWKKAANQFRGNVNKKFGSGKK
ncbi:MAG: RraA family protein [Prolixibacteraceae bacterium]|nr:RraA family protein [Prolixibacteraceae bacterium]